MEGKNVRTPEQQVKLQKDLFPIIEGLVKLIFPEGKIKYDELVGEKALKIHLNELHSNEILALSAIAKENSITIKRSGYGVTVLITLGRPKEVGESSKSE